MCAEVVIEVVEVVASVVVLVVAAASAAAVASLVVATSGGAAGGSAAHIPARVATVGVFEASGTATVFRTTPESPVKPAVELGGDGSTGPRTSRPGTRLGDRERRREAARDDRDGLRDDDRDREREEDGDDDDDPEDDDRDVAESDVRDSDLCRRRRPSCCLCRERDFDPDLDLDRDRERRRCSLRSETWRLEPGLRLRLLREEGRLSLARSRCLWFSAERRSIARGRSGLELRRRSLSRGDRLRLRRCRWLDGERSMEAGTPD